MRARAPVAALLLAVVLGLAHASCKSGSGLFVPTTNAVPIFDAAGRVVGSNYCVGYAVNSGFTNAIGNAREFNRALPGPWSGLVDGFLAGALGVVGWIAKRKHDQASVVPVLLEGLNKSANKDEVETAIVQAANDTRRARLIRQVARELRAARVRADFGKPK